MKKQNEKLDYLFHIAFLNKSNPSLVDREIQRLSPQDLNLQDILDRRDSEFSNDWMKKFANRLVAEHFIRNHHSLHELKDLEFSTDEAITAGVQLAMLKQHGQNLTPRTVKNLALKGSNLIVKKEAVNLLLSHAKSLLASWEIKKFEKLNQLYHGI